MEEKNIKREAWIDFLLCFFLGSLGIHKFREMKVGMGLLYFFTGGLFYVGWLYDWVRYLIIALGLTFGKHENKEAAELKANWGQKAKSLGLYITIGLLVLSLGSCAALGALVANTCSHEYEEPTCTEASVCTLCGEAFGEPLGHNWEDATCSAPKSCSSCGETEGEALAHTFAAATCAAPKTCTVCKLTEGEAFAHTWEEATCEVAKTCSVCKATEGEAKGHTWKDANCEAPKTCAVCKATEGEAGSHSWKSATCKAPKTCSVCGETTGSKGSHKYVSGKCSVCGTKKASSSSGSSSSGSSSNNSGGRTVYRTPSGKRYHFDPDCGGKNSYAISWNNIGRLTPCQKCAY